MKKLAWLVVWLGMVTGATLAAGPEGPAKPAAPTDLPAAMEAQAAVRAAITREFNDRQDAVRKWFPTALDALQKEATTRGNLDGVLAVKNERARAERALTPAEMAALPEPLHGVRLKYDQVLAALATEQTAREAASLRDYLAALESLEKRTTQRGEIDNALKIREEIGSARIQWSQLETMKPPSVPAARASTPAPTLPVAAPMPPAPKGTPAPPPATVAATASSHPALIGTWHFTWTETRYETDFTFAADGTFKAKDGGPAGTWKVDGNQILMDAPDTAEKIIFLPINPQGTKVLDQRKNRNIKAVKLKP